MTNTETTISLTQPSIEGKGLGMAAPTRQLCDEVRERIHDFEGRARKEVVEIGALLIRVKNELEHGAFKKWLDAEVRWNVRTAQNYMNVAKNIGDKYETVSHLPLKTLYELAAPVVSDQERQELIASIIDPENPPVAHIKKRLGDVREQAKLATKRADLGATRLKGESASAQKFEPTKREAGQDKPEDRVQKEQLVWLAKSWLFRMVELAPEILATVKSHGAYDLGVAIGEAAEAIIATKQTPKIPPHKPEPVTPKPTKPEEITLPTSEYGDVVKPDDLNDLDMDFSKALDNLDHKAAHGLKTVKGEHNAADDSAMVELQKLMEMEEFDNQPKVAA